MLVLTEDQELLRQSARDVVAGERAVQRLRAMRDAGRRDDPELWERLVDLGWPAIPYPEDAGGLGLGLPEAAVVMEELGRGLAPAPMASTIAAAALDPAFGDPTHRVVAFAWREHPRVARAEPVQTVFDGGRVSGRKVGVLDGSTAQALLVSAHRAGRTVVCRVEPDRGVTVVPLNRMDHRDAADVVLHGAPCDVVGDGDTLRRGLAHLAVALAAEALGAACGAFELTRAWLHEREQFGTPIGSFQALQHRMVDAFVQLELTRSAVLQAARDPTSAWASLAAHKAGETFLHVAKEAVQLHGGIGMTDEHDVGFYLKRAMVLARELESLAAALR